MSNLTSVTSECDKTLVVHRSNKVDEDDPFAMFYIGSSQLVSLNLKFTSYRGDYPFIPPFTFFGYDNAIVFFDVSICFSEFVADYCRTRAKQHTNSFFIDVYFLNLELNS